MWSLLRLRDKASLRFNRCEKRSLSIRRQRGGGVAKPLEIPPPGLSRWPGFLGSDWFQKGKNYSANTTIISCLATAHQSRETTQAASPRVCISNSGSLKEASPLSAGSDSSRVQAPEQFSKSRKAQASRFWG